MKRRSLEIGPRLLDAKSRHYLVSFCVLGLYRSVSSYAGCALRNVGLSLDDESSIIEGLPARHDGLTWRRLLFGESMRCPFTQHRMARARVPYVPRLARTWTKETWHAGAASAMNENRNPLVLFFEHD